MNSLKKKLLIACNSAGEFDRNSSIARYIAKVSSFERVCFPRIDFRKRVDERNLFRWQLRSYVGNRRSSGAMCQLQRFSPIAAPAPAVKTALFLPPRHKCSQTLGNVNRERRDKIAIFLDSRCSTATMILRDFKISHNSLAILMERKFCVFAKNDCSMQWTVELFAKSLLIKLFVEK